MVYDCCVHPSVIDEANEDQTGNQSNFLCQLALQVGGRVWVCVRECGCVGVGVCGAMQKPNV